MKGGLSVSKKYSFVIINNIGKKPSFKFELDFSKLEEVGQPLLKFLGETEELAQDTQDVLRNVWYFD